ncbi:MAG: multifunctional oxoglutarate decarboxylase/oxoglutarate dehydrogenase thiamine pyrophosphate-binding subunit/dihydrolipoyllysine-residue succinyltransferase subunit [Candidatus Eremiobacteraeota bacterium]|nr:multifunctional oxoglutarate decarboxylase/oxoglutarate dehydrogenase thiamine pyrophosphate-binding subunit/dihydrolipoyllysine-residue succinyltransferase subunit [Candidatus Eremiobacteraeota bacterium]
MGESVSEGTVTTWRRQVGDSVSEGEALVDVTTDKVDVEVPSPASGRVAKIHAKEGATVAVGAALADIDTSGSAADASASADGKASSPQAPFATDGARPGSSLAQIVMPAMGESVAEGTVGQWRKREEDLVAVDDIIVEITTDKVNVEVPAGVAGVLRRIVAGEGENVAVGGVLAEIAVEAETPAHTLPSRQAADSSRSTMIAAREKSAPVPSEFASPLARRAAALRGIELKGDLSEPGSVIRKADIAAIGAGGNGTPAGSSSKSSRSASAPGDATDLKGPAAALVGYMEQSLNIPTATSFRTMGVDVLDARRRELNAALKSSPSGKKLSFTHLVAFAIVRAVKDVPAMTVSFSRTSAGKPQRIGNGVHLGLAADVERKDGSRFLVVPVLRDATQLDFAAFISAYDALVAKARANALTAADMSGASITLTNPGGIGTSASVPRLMPNQGTIVAAGAISYPPGLASVSEEALKAMGVSKTLTLTSTYDHRVIQGAESGEFLRRIEELLGGAGGFYEEVFASLGLAEPVVVQTPRSAAFAPARTAPTAPSADIVRAAGAAIALVSRYRTHGHLAAALDPLADSQPVHPALDPATLELTPEMLRAVPASVLRVHVPGENFADVLERLRQTYCSTIAYEVEHISDHGQRDWLRSQIESGAHLATLDRARKLEVLERLTRVEVFERYLRKAFLGQKTFSIEGLDAMVPMLEELLSMLGDEGVREVDIGMAHRGRLSVITHVVDRPYEDVLVEFEHTGAKAADPRGDVTGDVKYHQGAKGTYVTPSGRSIAVTLANNPSHLEAVNSVIEGRTRAAQTDRSQNVARLDTSIAVPVLIHGDAAFTGQGTVAEVLNLQSLAGYTTGGTIHIIADNQIGFTTSPGEGRSTHYASDLAKGFDVPIVHVNADDIEACIGAIHLCVAFRRKFKRDALVHLIGYRRFGHNEADEPSYTQPLMYEKIRTHPTVREIFASRLIADGVATEDEIKTRLDGASERIAAAHKAVRTGEVGGSAASALARSQGSAALPPVTQPAPPPIAATITVDTRVPGAELQALNAALLELPGDFTLNPKLSRQLDRRRTALEPEGEIDWAIAEALAFGSLVQGSKPVRLTGQDTERGTFSHRHLVFHDVLTGARLTPMHHLPDAHASFEIYNSPLSEYACLGFEYGYSAAAPDALVLWEAQFGDFANGAQIIIDQFVGAGMAKWGQTSRLTLLLPHGYEGAGPEHSSARLERFLQLATEGSMRVANCSTPAQYFHLLRDQALSPKARPLVIMTPKSLLRMKAATSHLVDLTNGAFAPVIDDPTSTQRAAIRRLLLCSGKIYYDLMGYEQRPAATDCAIARVELLEPFPVDLVCALVDSYPNLRTVTWVQEEPKNMGARAFVVRHLRDQVLSRGLELQYVGRPDRASPSEGYPGSHAVEQQRIVATALAPVQSAAV